jgi:hypothetical protein
MMLAVMVGYERGGRGRMKRKKEKETKGSATMGGVRAA